MQTARMNLYVDVPVARVWGVLTDYAGYARFPKIDAARVVTPGTSDPAGVGAVREVRALGNTFLEEIVEFEPPRRLAYRIIKSRPLPIRHELGVIELIPRGSGTEVAWTTRFTVALPLVGELLARPLRVFLQHSFNEILLWLKDDLEASR